MANLRKLLCICTVGALATAAWAGVPTNDDCVNAIAITTLPASITEDTTLATADVAPLCGTTDGTAGGVWYSIIGDGTTLTASTCSATSTYDTKVRVYTGDCNALVCEAGDDDDPNCTFSGLRSTVSWCSAVGVEYKILVHGFSSAVGTFELLVSSSGANCLGACCLSDGSCTGGLTATACATAGGVYGGDGSDCNSVSCSGACCLSDGSCVFGSPDDCDTAGGVYQGNGSDCNSVTCPIAPDNDDCANAVAFTGVPGMVMGSTLAATAEGNIDPNLFCGTSISAPGAWHSVVGTGNTMTVTTCFAETDYDTKLNVYTGDCNNLVCVGGNDDDFGNPDCNFPRGIGFPSTVTFCSQPGVTYLILVQGFSSAVGDYKLMVSDDGVSCVGSCCLPDGNCVDGATAASCSTAGGTFNAGGTCATVECFGACCLSDGSCVQDTATGCATAGGFYNGDGSDCNAVTCTGACCFDDGSCSDLSEDDCATAGGTYQGTGSDCGSVTCPVVPENDDCENAIAFTSIPGSVSGSNVAATPDGLVTCGTSAGSAAVWYTLVGTGNQIRLTTCADGTNFDTKIHVYCGDCNGLTCVGGNDDGSPSGLSPDPNCVTAPPSTANRASTVTFCSQNGATYLIAVFGFSTATGDFVMNAVDLGTPCEATVACLPTGACCVGLGCTIETALDCATAGGTYQGDGTICGGQVYQSIDDCNNAFEDISATGTLAAFASSGDDNAEEVGIGFTFTFFDNDHNSVWVSSNGLMVFNPTTELDADDFSNDQIPSTILPNNFIAPLWDDLTTTAATATVHVETQGAAPNRRTIVQWTMVPELSGAIVPNTFQAILSEGSNKIELRYLVVDAEATALDYTVGVENPTGTAGVGLGAATATLASGDCFCILPICYANPCCPDIDGGGNVDLADLAGLLASFGSSAGDANYDSKADLDQDGDVDLSDLAGLLAKFGLACP